MQIHIDTHKYTCVKYITLYRQPVNLNLRRRQKEGALLEISSVTVFTSPFHKVDIENLVLVVIGKNSVKIFKKKLKMPKEFHDFDMTKPPGASWGIRIGGGVDRGKVLVLEKVSRFLPFVSFANLLLLLFVKRDCHYFRSALTFPSIEIWTGLKMQPAKIIHSHYKVRVQSLSLDSQA